MTTSDSFQRRHLGPRDDQAAQMAHFCGFDSVDALADAAVPASIRFHGELNLPPARTEAEALRDLASTMSQNRRLKSLIGLGFHDCVTPPVIKRSILENPGWYTAYTPYQPEISQGRLEALLNFQTMVADLTGLDIANASLLDEGTAAAEAIALAASFNPKGHSVFVSDLVHPTTLAVVQTRAQPLGINVITGDIASFDPADHPDLIAVLLQYPDTLGRISDPAPAIARAKSAGVVSIVATDLLALTILKPPGELGADICVGSSGRFGVPLGFGGPHAAFIAVRDHFKRKLPGRLIGVSKDASGNRAYRLALQTREQHIRRDKATSNICTAQVLLAVIASMFAVYHGPQGLKEIASRIHRLARSLAAGLRNAGSQLASDAFFDTVTASVENADSAVQNALHAGFNIRRIDAHRVSIALDETSTPEDVAHLLLALGAEVPAETDTHLLSFPADLHRHSDFLTHPVFHSYHSETEMLRYLHRLETKDLALNHSMIALGSCTMKLNAAAEMMPLGWPDVAGIHPFAPHDQTAGYRTMLADLESWLSEITGFAATSLQPNAGSQGEYAGLIAIRRYLDSINEGYRNVCLIPTSAHGTNPASAVMAGFKVVAVACDHLGNIDIADLRNKALSNADELGALMVTYPSTHGVFEEGIREICQIIHHFGGQVYMDGANMNAQVGLCRPGDLGADVCHLNLHKTFCIPHGGGGPGVGPISVAAHLADFLPGHSSTPDRPAGAVCSAPFGSASICTISWMYIAMMGPQGLAKATKTAILNANYITVRLRDFFPVLYSGARGLVAHECIIDLREFNEISVEDVAKRLIDYGFHAPTMSWPVPGTLMIEPTESESRSEIDRFCDALISIHGEIKAIADGNIHPEDNPLKNAPHTAQEVVSDIWEHPYGRELAAYPAPWLRSGTKYWPPVGRVDNVFGDRNLVCSCGTVDDYGS